MQITDNILAISYNSVDVKDLMSTEQRSNEEINRTLKSTGFYKLSSFRGLKINEVFLKIKDSLSIDIIEKIQNIDVLVTVTQSQTQRMPNLSSNLQDIFGIKQSIVAYDIIDGCNGFVKAAHLMNSMLRKGQTGLIVSGEMNSMLTEKSELSTKILFGDGFALTLFDEFGPKAKSIIHQDGSSGQFIKAEFSNPVLEMDGFEVFRFTNTVVPKLFDNQQLIRTDEHVLVFHQASELVVGQLAKKLNVQHQEPAPFISGSIGNLASGSIPGWIAISGSRLSVDAKLLCIGYGAGLSWGMIELNCKLDRNEVVYV